MKQHPEADYPIKPFLHTAENEGSAFYAGIYGLRLNYSVGVCLCPAYDVEAYHFPPDPQRLLARNPLDVQSADAARAETAILGAQLVLLEKEDQAGQLICGVYRQLGPDLASPWQLLPAQGQQAAPYFAEKITYFYCVTRAEYVAYATELDTIMDRRFHSANPEEAPRSYNKLSNLSHFRVIALIHELLSGYPAILSDYKRELLAL